MSKIFLVKSAIVITASEIIFNLSAFLVHAVVGRILGPEDYGRYGLVVTLTTMIIILVGNGVPTAMAKYISEIFETNPQLIRIIKRQAIFLQFIVIGALTLLFFLSAPLIARLLGDATLTNLFRISSLIIPAFAAASFYFSYFTGLHKFNIQSFLKIIRSILRLVFIIALAYFFQLEGSIIGYIVVPTLVFLFALAIDKFRVSKEISAKTKKFPVASKDSLVFPWKKLVNYAWQIVVFFLAYELLISIDLYLVKAMLASDYLTGIYNASLTAGRIPYYLFYALTVVLLPAISKSTAEKKEMETKKIISQSLRIMLLLLVPAIILMVSFSKPIISLFYGENYFEAARPMSVLLWGVGFLTIFYVMSFIMNGAGKTKISMYVAILGFILNAILNYYLIKKYGLMGSAAATSIASFAAMSLMLYFIYREFGTLISKKSFFNVAIAGTGTFFFASFFRGGEFIFFFWSLLIFVFYLILLYLLDEIKGEDFVFIKNLVAHGKSKSSNQF